MEKGKDDDVRKEFEEGSTNETATDDKEDHDDDNNSNSNKLKDRKSSWANLRRVDSLNLEAAQFSSKPAHAHAHAHAQVNWSWTLRLAFQSLGVIYGDIGTSPLYVFSSTFPGGLSSDDHKNDILGALSLIIYTLILLPFIKYAFIVLWANDNGDGGTFALYSLLCKHVKMNLIPNQQPEDLELSQYRLERPSSELKRACKTKQVIEESRNIKLMLFVVTILGTSLVLGDGVLTPSISVLSAVGGISSLGQNAVVGVSVAILVLLFSVQRFGTDRVGYSFAPIVCVWFAFIAGIGVYNLFAHDITVLRAFNPYYIGQYFQKNGKKGWISLGGVFLCITGTEAMFADIGHFSVRAVQVSLAFVTLPALLLAYIGQAAYLTKFPENVDDAFYKSIPDAMYWPTFVSAVGAAIFASQALISGSFAIISQSLTLGCFPRVKVVHTSAKYEGQVYIPEINYALMIACVLVTVGFKSTDKIGHAYGIAVVSVMMMTTCMVTLIMVTVWKTRLIWIAAFFIVFMAIELVFASSVFYKFTQGGYLPLALASVLMTIMGIWHYVHEKRYAFELNNKVSGDHLKQLVTDSRICRVPGIGLFYSELVQGIPPIFSHYLANVPSIHSVLLFVSIKNLPISRVEHDERFLFREAEPREYRMFRCVARFGYKDTMPRPEEFERQLVDSLTEFIRHRYFTDGWAAPDIVEIATQDHSGVLAKPKRTSGSAVQALPHVQPRVSSGSIRVAGSTNLSNRVLGSTVQEAEEEIQFVRKAKEEGVVYLLGEAEVVAEPQSSMLKKMTVNYGYNFLKKNFRQGEKVMAIPHTKLLRVGMTYEI